MDLVEIMQAIDMENQQLTNWGPRADRHKGEKEEEEEEENVPSPTPAYSRSPARTSFVDFSAAQKRERIKEVAQKTKQRGQVSQSGLGYIVLASFPGFTLVLRPIAT